MAPTATNAKGAFCTPLPVGAQTVSGNLGRNARPRISLQELDFSLHRDFPIHESIRLRFQADMFNVFNHPSFGPEGGTLNATTFGTTTSMANSSLGSQCQQWRRLQPDLQYGRSAQLPIRAEAVLLIAQPIAGEKRRKWTARLVFLKIHLWLGLVGAIFLVILGLTGSIMAFEAEIDRWVHPGLWYVDQRPQTLPQQQLIDGVQRRFAPARVAMIQIFRQGNLAEIMQMTDRSAVFVNPYDGAVLGRTTGPSSLQKTLGAIHQIHLRLAPDPRAWPSLSKVGKVIVSFAGLILFLQVPIGIYLWWRTKRASIQWKASWFRICFDAHHVFGLYGALFLAIAAFTGVLIGFDFGEEAIYSLTHSKPPTFPRPPQSTASESAGPIGVDRAVEIARQSMPDASVAGIMVPLNAKASVNVLMRVPEETSESVHSVVSIDQYSGQVLRLKDFKTDSLGYRVIRFNRSIHTGDVLGLPTHIIVSLIQLAVRW